MIKAHGSWRLLLVVLVSLFISCAIRPMPEYEKDPPLPQLAGELQVPGLQDEVKVYRDGYGVPHIFADNEHDLFFADGYVQAQDRLWEIMFFRAIATGRLSEMFGNIGVPGSTIRGMKLSTFEIDKRMRTMGMRHIGETGEALLAETQPEILAQMQAFCDGVNAYLESHRDNLPIEFQVLYYEPDPLRPADIVALSRFYGSNLSANMGKELSRYALARKYGHDMAWKLMPLHDAMGPTVVPKELLNNRLDKPRPLVPERMPYASEQALSGDAAMRVALFDKAVRIASFFPKDEASNNWVIGPSMTTTGTAMMANDPHLVHIEPSLCYLMHLKGAGRDAYGVVFPGQPYIVMGHGRHMSWGATVTGADVQDIYIETVSEDHPGQYLYKGEWRDFTVREEVIKIRPGTVQTGPDRRYREKKIKIRHTVHGPIINDMVPGLPDDTPPLALRWVGWDFSRHPDMFEEFVTSATVEEAMEKLRAHEERPKVINVAMMFDTWMQGKGVDDFIEGLSYNVLLNMNWVCADSSGHIAYMPGSLVPRRKKGLGVMPVPGASGEYDWEGFIPFDELPQVIDPDRGWMATANNEVVEAEWYPHVFATGYSGGWRAWRIEELIEELKPISMDDMKRIQNDVYVKQADVFVPMIVEAVKEKAPDDRELMEAAMILERWNRYATIDSAGAAVFYETLSYFTDNVLEDDFKKQDYNKLIKGHVGHTVKMWLINDVDDYMDDKRTPHKVEDKNDVLTASLKDAVKWLKKELGRDMQKWQWGKLHTIKWYHPMGFGPLKEMSIGPFPHPGGDSTVRNASSMGIGGNKHMCMGGPVMRHIIDMGEPDKGQIVIDGSQSGQWLSPHYRDMHTLWYNSKYIDAEKRPEKVAESADKLLVLKP